MGESDKDVTWAKAVGMSGKGFNSVPFVWCGGVVLVVDIEGINVLRGCKAQNKKKKEIFHEEVNKFYCLL